MFNSVIIDVAIGLTLSFLAVSLAASAVTEAISSALQWRQATLLQGVKDLLNDQDFKGLALQLYNHALVNPLASGAAATAQELTNKPAYIDSRGFALALCDTLSKNAGAGESPEAFIDKIQDPQLKNAMTALWTTSSKNVESFKHSVGEWFDASMDRLSGRYKRMTQLVSFIIALAIAALFNVNALYMSAQIWTHPTAMADIATLHVDQQAGQAADVSKILGALEPQYLVGWVKGPTPDSAQTWFIALTSWLLVSAATLFGASFWFDVLQHIVQIRGTGLAPKRTPRPAKQ
ncbi:MAG TPA: hypothetical protein VEH77_02505 [Roseiarcus sp.]|nr:hypothetical protein [Roseiarcus sp.]